MGGCKHVMGWEKYDLCKLYTSHIRSIICFASSGWQPWLSATNVQKLEVLQNKCLRIISGQTRTSPTDACRAKTGIQSIASHINARCLKSREKSSPPPTRPPQKTSNHCISTIPSQEGTFTEDPGRNPCELLRLGPTPQKGVEIL